MKFVKIFILLLALGAFVLCSCEKEASLTILETDFSFESEGGSATIMVESNKNWTVSSDASWCVPSLESAGSNVKNFSIQVEANTTYDTRACILTVRCEQLFTRIRVSQNESDGLVVSPLRYELSNDAQDLQILLQSNVDYDLNVDCKWIVLNSIKSLTSRTLDFSILANETYDSREGTIVISQKGGILRSTIKVFQSQVNAIILSTKEYNLGCEETPIKVDVRSNVTYSVIIPSDVNWIKLNETKALELSTLLFTVAENETYDSRTATITIKNDDTGISEDFTVFQNQKGVISLNKKSVVVSPEGETLEIVLQTSVGQITEIPFEAASWISIVSSFDTKSLDRLRIYLKIEKNLSYSERSANVIFRSPGVPSVPDTLKITQLQNDAILLDKGDVTLDFEENTLAMDISHNVDYSINVACDGGWLTRTSATRALVTTPESFHVEMNLGTSDREGTISILDKDQKVVKSIKVTQKCMQGATFLLSSDPGLYNYDKSSSLVFDQLNNQMFVEDLSDAKTFGFLWPSKNNYIVFSGLPKSLSFGDEVSLRIVQNYVEVIPSNAVYDLKVVKKSGSLVWLKDVESALGAIVYESL